MSQNQQESEYQKYAVTDGNGGVSLVAYSFSDLVFIFPITPATSMGEKADEFSCIGKKNVFDDVVKVTQMQSEGGVSGALHGALLSGALASTFTCSQGLLLMIPEMYKIAGEMLPAVIHVAARAVGSQGMSIYADHCDVYATKATGWSLLASGSVQESVDLATIAHLTTHQASIPILHFFDGFRVSHEIQKILSPTMELFKKLVDLKSIMKWRETRTMRNNNATMRTVLANEDVYFPLLEASNGRYDAFPDIMQGIMDLYGALTGRSYRLFQYYGDPNAELVVVAMGTTTRTFNEYIEYASSLQHKRRYGLIAVHLFKPFSIRHFVAALPATCTHLTVLDRSKEAGSTGEALYQECLGALYQSGRLFGVPDVSGPLKVASGRCCLGGIDVTPSIAQAVFANMEDPRWRCRFTVGVRDDVTHLSLPLPSPPVVISHAGVTEALFFGLGADGTVGSVKSAMGIIGDNTPLYSQAYFVYDAKKSGGVTQSNVRFGAAPIVSQYEIYSADYLACHHPSYVTKYEMLRRIKDKGVFVLNTPNTDIESLGRTLPGQMKKALVEKQLAFYVIDAERISASVKLRGRINMVMQTVFFYLSRVLPSIDVAVRLLKDSCTKAFKKKGEEVIAQNHQCIDQTIANIVRIVPPADWAACAPITLPVFPSNTTPFFSEFCAPVLGLRGEELRVSDLVRYNGGVFPTATSQYEKRNVSAVVPQWKAADCVQCNQCSFVCALSAIRPFLVQQGEYKRINKDTNTLQKIPLLGIKDPNAQDEEKKLSFTISISTADCVGCGVCVSTCPKQCLTMVDNHTAYATAEQTNYNALLRLPNSTRAKLLWNPEDDWARRTSTSATAVSVVASPTTTAVASVNSEGGENPDPRRCPNLSSSVSSTSLCAVGTNPPPPPPSSSSSSPSSAVSTANPVPFPPSFTSTTPAAVPAPALAPTPATAPAPTPATAPAPSAAAPTAPVSLFPLTPVPSYKAVSFQPPLLEYCGACGGCAESPLVRVLTQMFGERMVLAVSCGCSMAWGGATPTCPYTVNEEGLGPAYTGSLFEDTAEYALGIAMGGLQVRTQLSGFIAELRRLLEDPNTSIAILEQILGTDTDTDTAAVAAESFPSSSSSSSSSCSCSSSSSSSSCSCSSSSSSSSSSCSSSSSSSDPSIVLPRASLPLIERRTLLLRLLTAWLAAADDPYQSKRVGQLIQRFFGVAVGAKSTNSTNGTNGTNDPGASTVPGDFALQAMELAPAVSHRIVKEIWTRRDLLQRKSYWCLGGDGWAYDIGFGGLDHVLQVGLNINILVMDTEVYSNTGGQRSKATPRGAVAKFAAGGKDTRKKDLGFYAINVGSVYVATVAQGANPQQLIRALHEAEQFPGTSLVIALCPCINWSFKKGQGNAVQEEKNAVKCGYWPLYRYNPLTEYEEETVVNGETVRMHRQGVLTLDSGAPSLPHLSEWLNGQNRFTALTDQKATAETGRRLQFELQKDVLDNYSRLVQIAERTNPQKKK